ncbi:PLC-like phosphodiesterase [Irpex lacteus]|nr:PLC-like phosphodiesterase [Irpex lacteus]
MAPKHASSWMQTHLHVLGDLPLSKVCLPASHDAGTYRLGWHTSFGTESNVLTQTRSIFDQLELGVRYLEVRPVLTSPAPGKPPGLWAAGHYTGEGADKVGWQGGNCMELREIIDEVNRFTQDNPELVFVEISHLHRITIDNPLSSSERSLNREEQLDLLGQLSKFERLFSASDSLGKDKPLHDYTLNQFLGKGHGAVVVLVGGMDGLTNEIFEHRLWPFDISPNQPYFSARNSASYITHTQTTGEAISSTISFSQMIGLGPGANGDSILSLAKREQAKRFPWILSEYAESYYPPAIFMDRIQNLDLLTFCLAVTMQGVNASLGRTDTIIVYGGKLITNPSVHQVVRTAIDRGVSLQVTNDSVGGGEDPWSGMTKSCAVYYHHNGLCKARFAVENQALHFEEDVLEITYGGKDIKNQAAISQRQSLQVTNDTLGGDPAFGVRKVCKVKFRDMNTDKVREEQKDEDAWFDFETFWEKMGKAAAAAMQHPM